MESSKFWIMGGRVGGGGWKKFYINGGVRRNVGGGRSKNGMVIHSKLILTQCVENAHNKCIQELQKNIFFFWY